MFYLDCFLLYNYETCTMNAFTHMHTHTHIYMLTHRHKHIMSFPSQFLQIAVSYEFRAQQFSFLVLLRFERLSCSESQVIPPLFYFNTAFVTHSIYHIVETKSSMCCFCVSASFFQNTLSSSSDEQIAFVLVLPIYL